MQKPNIKTKSPLFGSGPTKKPEGWHLPSLSYVSQGRSHRSQFGINILNTLEDTVRENLDIPKNHKVAFVTGSATAAIEAALWNLIGINNITIFDFDTFADRWALDIKDQLKPNVDIEHIKIKFGEAYHFQDNTPQNDILFCWNGSTSGLMMPHLSWLQENREGLVFCDATSAAYCSPLPFEKLDVTAFSFQKGLGSEAGLGCLVLSPKAYKCLEKYTPSWPIPRLLRLNDSNRDVFSGKLLNTPSMLTIEEIIYCHTFFDKKQAYTKAQENKKVFERCLKESSIFKHALQDENYRSCSTGVFIIQQPNFLTLDDHEKHQIINKMAKTLADENVAYDFANHPSQPPSFRIWLGHTISCEDIKTLFTWLTWAFNSSFLKK